MPRVLVHNPLDWLEDALTPPPRDPAQPERHRHPERRRRRRRFVLHTHNAEVASAVWASQVSVATAPRSQVQSRLPQEADPSETAVEAGQIIQQTAQAAAYYGSVAAIPPKIMEAIVNGEEFHFPDKPAGAGNSGTSGSSGNEPPGTSSGHLAMRGRQSRCRQPLTNLETIKIVKSLPQTLQKGCEIVSQALFYL